MDQPLLDVMQARHSVRAYRDTPITGDTLAALQACIEDCSRQSGLHIQLVREEPRAFDGFMAHYGKFSGVKNYIAMVGKKGPALEQTCGYWGQRVVRLYDPDRHILEIGENMKAVCRRFRDQGMTPEQIAARMEVPLKFVTGCLR